MNARRSRAPFLSAAISVAAVVELGLMALFAAMNPQPVPTVNDAPDPSVIAANQGAVMWPAFLAVLSLLAAVAVLRRPDRFTYLFAAALGLFMIGLALTLPDWLATIRPLAVLVGLTGAAAVIVAIVGWLPSPPLPESLPGWPEHHGGI
jgi:hypothetical protein